MFLGIMASLYMVSLFTKNDKTFDNVTKYTRIPISTKLSLAALFYVVGMAIPFLINLVARVFSTGFNVTSLAVPLFGSSFTGQAQSFATASISESTSWKIYNIMFVAGNMEIGGISRNFIRFGDINIISVFGRGYYFRVPNDF